MKKHKAFAMGLMMAVLVGCGHPKITFNGSSITSSAQKRIPFLGEERLEQADRMQVHNLHPLNGKQ
jgi:hypothetical protein